MLLRGLLGQALLWEGSGGGETLGPRLRWSCGCHRERSICGGGGGVGDRGEVRRSRGQFHVTAGAASKKLRKRSFVFQTLTLSIFSASTPFLAFTLLLSLSGMVL